MNKSSNEEDEMKVIYHSRHFDARMILLGFWLKLSDGGMRVFSCRKVSNDGGNV